jgi:RNase H-fold protein (predicted Holliday junction resolvase)
VADEEMILAIDPGRGKCGLAVVTKKQVIHRAVIPRERIACAVRDCLERFQNIDRIILGDRTGSAELRDELEAVLSPFPISFIDEHLSTQEARHLYWQANPPRGWRRLLPLSLQAPPEPYDDLVAVVLARRYLGRDEKSPF